MYCVTCQYYYRPEWELYDRKADPRERLNVAGKRRYQPVLAKLQVSPSLPSLLL